MNAPDSPSPSLTHLLAAYGPDDAFAMATDRAAEFRYRAEHRGIDVDLRLFYERRAAFWSGMAERISDHNKKGSPS